MLGIRLVRRRRNSACALAIATLVALLVPSGPATADDAATCEDKTPAPGQVVVCDDHDDMVVQPVVRNRRGRPLNSSDWDPQLADLDSIGMERFDEYSQYSDTGTSDTFFFEAVWKSAWREEEQCATKRGTFQGIVVTLEVDGELWAHLYFTVGCGPFGQVLEPGVWERAADPRDCASQPSGYGDPHQHFVAVGIRRSCFPAEAQELTASIESRIAVFRRGQWYDALSAVSDHAQFDRPFSLRSP